MNQIVRLGGANVIGTTISHYEVLAKLGEGGMGEVWKARDTRLDRLVALKVSKEQFAERFAHEARASRWHGC